MTKLATNYCSAMVAFQLFSVIYLVAQIHLSWATSVHNEARDSFPDLYEASVVELQTGLQRRQFTSVDLVKVRVFTQSIYQQIIMTRNRHTLLELMKSISKDPCSVLFWKKTHPPWPKLQLLTSSVHSKVQEVHCTVYLFY